LCRELSAWHDVSVLCAEYDPARRHGHVEWRVHEGLPVIEIVNNWICRRFADTYRPPLVNDRIAHVLRALQPHIVHVHNLLNLSFDLPAIAHARGIPVVATLHDYALVCPSGGQRIHQAEQHVCQVIETERCARCFRESPFHAQIAFGRLAAATSAPGPMRHAAVSAARRLPWLASRFIHFAQQARFTTLTSSELEERLSAARQVFEEVDLFVAPSQSIAAEFTRLGIDAAKIRTSDYGFVPLRRRGRNGGESTSRDRRTPSPLRLGFAGTLVWHKGVHVLVDAVRCLPPSAYELRIFGNPDVFPMYTNDLRARADGLPVHFMGPFDRAGASEVYSQMDVLVVPSLWLENSPLVIHEALMAGVPVVAARIGGIPELVDEGRTGLLYDPTSSDSLAATLRRLLEHPEDLRTLTSGARTAPRIKSIAEDAREWEDTYTSMVGPGAPVGVPV
jgi:glycosyltransferase involved in cell wall biosynthesis